jgi:transcriptional regulator with XRE-family HTH domain
MKQPSLEMTEGIEILSRAMRAIRRKRGLTLIEVAAAMAMPRRTYEEFEAGRGPVTHERLFAFADATDSDPYALVLCVAFGMPDFAVDCADTKLALILMTHLREFAATEGPDINYLDPNHVIGGAERLFTDLSGKLSDRAAFLQNWLDNRTGWVSLSNLKVRGVKRRQGRK